MPRKTNFTTAAGNDYYRTTLTVGRDADGKPIRKQFYGASKRESEQKRDEYKAGLGQGLAVGYEKAAFGAAFGHWLKHVRRHTIRHTTFIRYEQTHRLHIAPCELAGLRLVDIGPEHVQSFYNALLERTNADNVHRVHKLLSAFFKYCIKASKIATSPLRAVGLPRLPPSKLHKALPDSDIEKLVNACKEDIRHFPFLFCLFSGLRSGELLALTCRDIDFAGCSVSVSKSVSYTKVDGKHQHVVNEAKTASSVRTVPIIAEIMPMLEAHIAETARRLGSAPGDGLLLFPTATGAYRDKPGFLQAYKRLCEKLGIEEGRTIHSLRHTFCTILARQGVSLLDASRLMGHSDINVTAKIYSHVTDADKKNAVRRLAAYFLSNTHESNYNTFYNTKVFDSCEKP